MKIGGKIIEKDFRKELYSATYLSKSYGFKSAKELNLTLERLKIQKKDKFSNTWKFTEEFRNKGWDKLTEKEVAANKKILNRKFTWIGMIEIRKLLTEKGAI
ncbi:MAG: hypothetical protein ACRC0S_02110 [Fusobacteriaceae bacterium]